MVTKYVNNSEWLEHQDSAQKALEKELMGLERFASTPVHHEAIRTLLERSKEERRRIERSIEARSLRSDPIARR